MSMNTCTNFKFISSEKADVCRFECPKSLLLTLRARISAIFRLSNFVQFGPSKKCFRSFFAFLAKIGPKTCITPPKPKVLYLTFFDFVTLDDLDLARSQKA